MAKLVNYTCPHCGVSLQARRSSIGSVVRCKACGNKTALKQKQYGFKHVFLVFAFVGVIAYFWPEHLPKAQPNQQQKKVVSSQEESSEKVILIQEKIPEVESEEKPLIQVDLEPEKELPPHLINIAFGARSQIRAIVHEKLTENEWKDLAARLCANQPADLFLVNFFNNKRVLREDWDGTGTYDTKLQQETWVCRVTVDHGEPQILQKGPAFKEPQP